MSIKYTKKSIKDLVLTHILSIDGLNVAGETYGRGPLMLTLPAIKTANLTVEIILENAQMSISGMYQVEDDGVINIDNIALIPGNDNSKGGWICWIATY